MRDFSSNHEWISLHIFYKYDLDLLLLHVIDPVLCQWYDDGLVSNHFFIRYWEGGQHIRLRMKVPIYTAQRLARDLIRTYDANFQAAVRDPCFRVIPSNYSLELERFGGHQSIWMTEELFKYSSMMVMHILKRHRNNWSYSSAMSHALQMHLLFIKAMGLGEQLTIQLLDFLFELYLKYALRCIRPGNLRREIIKVNRFFEQSYRRQENEIDFLCASVWNEQTSDESDWRSQWTAEIGDIAQRFNIYKVSNELMGMDFSNRPSLHQMPKELLQQWFYLSSYFHLTNNRLGIHLRDESFIYFCLKQGLLANSDVEKDVLLRRS